MQSPVSNEEAPLAEMPVMENKAKKNGGGANNVKIAVIIILIALVGSMAFVYKGLFIAAMVDGSPITRLAVIQQLEKTSGKAVLDNLIIQKVISNEAKNKGIAISDEEVSAEIAKISESIESQGGTLEEALIGQKMTMDDLNNQINLQKKVEGLVADKVVVTDEEVEQYITDNQIDIPEGDNGEFKNQVREQLYQQKLQQEAGALVDTLRAQAKIQYFTNY